VFDAVTTKLIVFKFQALHAEHVLHRRQHVKFPRNDVSLLVTKPNLKELLDGNSNQSSLQKLATARRRL